MRPRSSCTSRSARRSSASLRGGPGEPPLAVRPSSVGAGPRDSSSRPLRSWSSPSDRSIPASSDLLLAQRGEAERRGPSTRRRDAGSPIANPASCSRRLRSVGPSSASLASDVVDPVPIGPTRPQAVELLVPMTQLRRGARRADSVSACSLRYSASAEPYPSAAARSRAQPGIDVIESVAQLVGAGVGTALADDRRPGGSRARASPVSPTGLPRGPRR